MTSPKDYLESLLLSCPGFVGEIARSVDSHLKHSRPSISLPAALAFASAIKSGRVVSETGIECSLYVLSLAPTGYGKTTAQKVLEDIAKKAQIKDLFGLEPTSDTGLISGLKLQPRQLILWEEFGEALDDLSHSKNSPKATVLRAMTDAFSAAGRTLRGKQYADGHKNEAENIYLSVFGVSNEYSFYNSLNERFVHNGFLGRWLCFVPDKIKPDPRPLSPIEVSEECINWLRNIDIWRPAIGNLASAIKKDKKVIKLSTSPTYRSEFSNYDNLAETCETETERAFWIRAAEIFTKLCLILTDKHPEENSIQWCSLLVQELVSQQIARCNEFMMGNSEKAKDKAKFIRLIALGEEMPSAKLFKKAYRLALSSEEKSAMIDMLVESECWEEYKKKVSPTSKKETTFLKCVKIFKD